MPGAKRTAWKWVLGLGVLGVLSGCAQGRNVVTEQCQQEACQTYCVQAGYGQGECFQGACLCHYTPAGLDGGWHGWMSDAGDACGGCPAGQACCGSVCQDVMSDPFNCGRCGKVCKEGEECVNGWCTCGGRSPCYDFEKCCNGQCVNILYDPTNCGDCGVVCQPETGPDCFEGHCVCPEVGNENPRACDGTREDMCCPRTFLASGGCTDLDTDREHCGSCGHHCDTFNGEICFQGQCVLGQN